jgi:protein-L-isoaspartate(D-aspartate) O-methyltransferase
MKERDDMVRSQIAERAIRDPRVLEAMRSVPRHRFVSEEFVDESYGDYPLPIGYGQTISQPYIVAYMAEVLSLRPDSRVLEIGTGSGYQAAVLALLAAEVFSIEIIPELAAESSTRLMQLGFGNVRVRNGDGYFGWPEEAPFDGIIVAAAASEIPPPLIEQLAEGGRLISPVGRGVQSLILMSKGGGMERKRLIPVRFVPLTRSNPLRPRE